MPLPIEFDHRANALTTAAANPIKATSSVSIRSTQAPEEWMGRFFPACVRFFMKLALEVDFISAPGCAATAVASSFSCVQCRTLPILLLPGGAFPGVVVPPERKRVV